MRAAAAANLLTVFLKTRAGADEGRIAPVCGAALAAGGAAGGIAMLRGDDADCVERMLRTVLGNVCGMVCDGAKANCAAKAGMALHGAMQALLPAIYVSGARAEDMALRLKYAGFPEERLHIEKDYAKLAEAIAGEKLPAFIMPTYTAMLALRKTISTRYGYKQYWE